ncbi:hypothetical protein SDC9_138467 [bioreactor metagenome]|uniref:SpoVT-AbrB domain-containing protein n=1 Tax=bioreactor metagenome TaxID=1076179 RepID=A0A645DQ22_9ZZZZ
MEVRKIFKAGNSCVISIPANMLKALGLKDGSHLTLEVNREQKSIILKPVVVKNSGMSIEFARLVDKLMVEYDYALRRLAE